MVIKSRFIYSPVFSKFIDLLQAFTFINYHLLFFSKIESSQKVDTPINQIPFNHKSIKNTSCIIQLPQVSTLVQIHVDSFILIQQP